MFNSQLPSFKKSIHKYLVGVAIVTLVASCTAQGSEDAGQQEVEPGLEVTPTTQLDLAELHTQIAAAINAGDGELLGRLVSESGLPWIGDVGGFGGERMPSKSGPEGKNSEVFFASSFGPRDGEVASEQLISSFPSGGEEVTHYRLTGQEFDIYESGDSAWIQFEAREPVFYPFGATIMGPNGEYQVEGWVYHLPGTEVLAGGIDCAPDPGGWVGVSLLVGRSEFPKSLWPTNYRSRRLLS